MTEIQKPTVPDQLNVRLGGLRDPLAARCDSTGESPREVIRLALAKELGQPVPVMRAGNPGIAEQATAGAQARWRRKPKGRKPRE